MKAKTSVTLSQEILAAMDAAIGPSGNRSQYIEKVLARHFRDLRRTELDRRDEEALRAYLASPEFESDVLEYGMDPLELGDEVEVLKDEACDTTRAEAGTAGSMMVV